MHLRSIYASGTPVEDRHLDLGLLYRLLSERDETTSISHRQMPSIGGHVEFVKSRPYQDWWIVEVDDMAVGAVYLSHRNEIGIFIVKEHQGNGYGPEAVRMIMALCGDGIPLRANINPQNARSIAMFEKLGFRHIQNTYEFSLSGAPISSSAIRR